MTFTSRVLYLYFVVYVWCSGKPTVRLSFANETTSRLGGIRSDPTAAWAWLSLNLSCRLPVAGQGVISFFHVRGLTLALPSGPCCRDLASKGFQLNYQLHPQCALGTPFIRESVNRDRRRPIFLAVV